jgi:hypothetical protein
MAMALAVWGFAMMTAEMSVMTKGKIPRNMMKEWRHRRGLVVERHEILEQAL